ncbi:hypothetical protein FW774_01520 (plasmid) [Pedobacter sp. BS3]|uniref:Ig-like domain-containing domain n=1 Tax=Pedobacter sp. BS3 TaxID=2567937 RepID=UPI0011ED5B90|nr:Ig-like domain-containing domain [Pedobacter sp. BS3]TZF85778.1 hypothetical protein FW774_01520 [Pedobacter sp. BS3]
MANFRKHYSKLIFLILVAAILLPYGCASIQQPTGGPKDSIPPKVLKETPANLTRNFNAKQINIQFDEYVKLKDEFKEISMSPAPDKMPLFKIVKKTLEIKLQDTLEKNTTYTINFGKGLVDYNEGNILKNYSYVFSTGNMLDSLTISGKVINTITKKPILDATVFILPISRDTIFGKKRASIFTSTDSSGNFSLKNLKEDTYRIYALKETEGGDRIYNSVKEEIGFLKDSIVLKSDVKDLLLETFNEEPENFRIMDKKITNDGHILLAFNKGIEKPSVKIVDPADLDSRKAVEFNRKADSVSLWLPEIKFDSIAIAVNDSSKALDTALIRRGKKDTYKNEVTISDNLASGKIKSKSDLLLTFSAPIAGFDVNKMTLAEDSIPVGGFKLVRDTASVRRYKLTFPWRLKRNYNITIADNAITGIDGGKNKAYNKAFTAYVDDNIGNLILNFTVPDTAKSYVILLLNSTGDIVRSDAINSNRAIHYTNIQAAKYNLRIVYDDNKNKKWDTGNVKKRIYPEGIWNYDKEFNIRPNWDLEEKITIPPLQNP